MNRKNDHPKVILELPENSFRQIEKRDRNTVDAIIENLTKQYKPMDPIAGIKIVPY